MACGRRKVTQAIVVFGRMFYLISANPDSHTRRFELVLIFIVLHRDSFEERCRPTGESPVFVDIQQNVRRTAPIRDEHGPIRGSLWLCLAID
jgi:hypothetical protein